MNIIIKELAIEFDGELECLGENTEKYKTFSVPIVKEVTKIDKNGNENVGSTSSKIKFLDSQGLWQIHYQIFLIISQNEFKKVNAYLAIKQNSNKINEELKKRFKNIFDGVTEQILDIDEKTCFIYYLYINDFLHCTNPSLSFYFHVK